MTNLKTQSISIICIAMLSGCTSTTHLTVFSHPSPESQFAEASIILEHNATDDDAEIVVFVKGGDEGLSSLCVTAPNGSKILDISTQDKAIGLREFAVESAEPGISCVVGAYPEGIYQIEGTTISGGNLSTSASFSHSLPSPPKINVDSKAGKVTWSSCQGATQYNVELEREIENKDVIKLTLELPATERSFSVPKRFLVPGDYQIGVAVQGKNGNITVVEHEFSIE